MTADGTSVNLRIFEILGCNFNGTYDDIKTLFAHASIKWRESVCNP